MIWCMHVCVHSCHTISYISPLNTRQMQDMNDTPCCVLRYMLTKNIHNYDHILFGVHTSYHILCHVLDRYYRITDCKCIYSVSMIYSDTSVLGSLNSYVVICDDFMYTSPNVHILYCTSKQ